MKRVCRTVSSRRFPGRHRGIALLEVLVSIIFLSAGVAGVMRAFYAAANIRTVVKNFSVGQSLVNGKIAELEAEALRAYENNRLKFEERINFNPAGTKQGVFEGNLYEFHWETSLEPVEEVYRILVPPRIGLEDGIVFRNVRFYRAYARVSWNFRGSPQDVELVSLFPRRLTPEQYKEEARRSQYQ